MSYALQFQDDPYGTISLKDGKLVYDGPKADSVKKFCEGIRRGQTDTELYASLEERSRSGFHWILSKLPDDEPEPVEG